VSARPQGDLPSTDPEADPMSDWFRKLLAGKAARPPAQHRTIRLQLEVLENRLTPTFSYHGGALLPHVEAQALFLGSDWVSSSTYVHQSQYLDAFVHNIVNTSYMDMLTTAGYGVGRGSASLAATDPIRIDKTVMLTDGAIQVDLQLAINAGLVKPPDANRLYVLFIEDNVPVGMSDGSVSRTDFLSYHGAFAGHTASGQPVDIRYVVVPYPGGKTGNLSVPGLTALQSMTECASHEIAESVTDPDVNYAALGWYDDALNDEIGDVVNLDYITLGGYVVQRIADRQDQGMTPVGAAPMRAVAFDLVAGGKLYSHTSAGWTFLQSGVASISSQTIGNTATASIDVVLTNGDAYEYYDGQGWLFLAHNVKQACSGEGVSYVLGTDGRLREYKDDSNSWTGTLATGVVSIDAGTDRYGASMVDFVTKTGVFGEASDSTGVHYWCSSAATTSAGTGGVSLVVLTSGMAYEFNEARGAFTHLADHIAHVAVGTDATGAAMFDLISTRGVATEYRTATGWKTLASGVAAVGKARAGLVDVVFANGNGYQHTASGWTALTTTVRQQS
jgi:hypothetical protein